MRRKKKRKKKRRERAPIGVRNATVNSGKGAKPAGARPGKHPLKPSYLLGMPLVVKADGDVVDVE
jgi:hypothetical protein